MIYTEKQKLDIKYGNHRWNVKSGATRSGKTYLDIDFKIVDRIIERRGKSGIAIICGKNYGTIERNVIIPLREVYGNLIGSITNTSKNKSTHIMIADEPVYLFGAGDISRIDTLRGSSVKYAYCDEVVSYNPLFFEMLKSRLDKEYSICDLTCNPDNPNHWFKEFMDSDVDKWILHFTIDDNPFLPPVFVEQLKKEYEGTVYYDRYILGLWVNAEGLIFLQFANNKNKYIIDRAENIIKIDIGVDFGGNKSKTMFIASAVVRKLENDNGTLREVYKLVVLEEHHVREKTQGAGIDAEQVAREHYDFYKKIAEKYNIIPQVSWCDHFDLAIIQIRNYHKLKGSNHKIDKVDKSSITLPDYILTINSLLNIEKLLILSQNIRVIESLSTLLYDEKSSKDAVLDDGTCDVDTYDAFRYSISRFLLQNNLYHWTYK
ncbi:terminase large subunit domain-containing protein [Brachyspira aalborgi]|jgi:PBSX family phage terminase large subunit|uniref:PBSX family phage terminase large subunit n=1 Tax=Brachyspira aalborgi TaxID=29522 RepID=A0ABY3K6M7_9SPIR|nr:terminase family protein [Brachyspira aalborgi]TXJ31164.1 hypothetical protein EPJ71_10545 [Brachyspira aalborgi]TXJ40054.1 hypothetical protein EPJ65_12485 [Brachyspira aalborgi]DAZ18849.1 MAG TPA: large terminase [Caudoviricetes sp.]